MYTTLEPSERNLYAEHLKRLDGSDRNLRFSGMLNDAQIDNYVNSIDFSTSRIKVIFEEGRVVAALHIAIIDNQTAEIGLSVDSNRRGKGYGKTLFDAAILWCQNRGIKKITTVCMAGNKWMVGMIRRYDGLINFEYGQAEGLLQVRESNLSTQAIENINEIYGFWNKLLSRATLSGRWFV